MMTDRLTDAIGIAAILVYYAAICSASAIADAVTGRERRLLQELRRVSVARNEDS